MLIGLLQTGLLPPELSSKHGEYPDMFERLLAGRGFDFRTWSVVNMDFPASVHDADGWLITGSRHGAYEDLPFIAPLEDFIRTAYAENVPMVGVCFGHQIIAQALGGKVEKFAGGWSVGAQDYDFGGETLTVNAWHQDQVTERPAEAQVVATSPFCANAALLYDGRAYTVQPHPEIENPYLEGLLDVRAPGLVPDDQIATARAAIGRPLDASRLADQFARFFRERRIA